MEKGGEMLDWRREESCWEKKLHDHRTLKSLKQAIGLVTKSTVEEELTFRLFLGKREFRENCESSLFFYFLLLLLFLFF